MGFYIRKGFNFGPLRLNLSRSGLGASVGVKGARIGVGPRGSYVQLGRAGLYYRQSLGRSNIQPRSTARGSPETPADEGITNITSASATSIVDSSAADLLKELNRVQARTDLFPVALIVGGFATVLLLWAGVPAWEWITAFILISVAAVYARHIDVTDGTAVLNYSLEEDASSGFSKLQKPFKELAQCQAVWHIDASAHTDDWKRHSGVDTMARRSEIRPSFALPPKVQCNLRVPTLKAGGKNLYFFPDRLLVYDSAGVGAVSYQNLRAQAGETRFVEQERIPGDAKQVGTTWRYVNKKGGPDRRFNDNTQIPIMLYGEFFLTSESGLKELFWCSPVDLASEMVSALAGLGLAKHPAGL